MFLNTFNAGADFTFSREPGTSCAKPAIEAELRYLEGVDCSDIRIEEQGAYIVLDGSVSSGRELASILRVSSEIVGRDNVICQIVVIPRDAGQTAFMLA